MPGDRVRSPRRRAPDRGPGSPTWHVLPSAAALGRSARGLEGDLDRDLASIPPHGHLHLVTGAFLLEKEEEVVRVLHPFAVDGDDDVAENDLTAVAASGWRETGTL